MKTDLESAIIAATAALLGVVISQIFSFLHKASERRHEQRILLRQKFEEMTFHFLKSLHWPIELAKRTTLLHAEELAASQDAQAAIVLCQLYFPEIVEALERYILVQQAYYDAVVESFAGADLTSARTAFSASSDSLNAEMFAAKNEVMKCIKKFAARYADAR
nr:hypothetical protein [uncultured Desulfobulbus sp.]